LKSRKWINFEVTA